jgi:hypothetical protein
MYSSQGDSADMFRPDLGLDLLIIPAGLFFIAGLVAAMFLMV